MSSIKCLSWLWFLRLRIMSCFVAPCLTWDSDVERFPTWEILGRNFELNLKFRSSIHSPQWWKGEKSAKSAESYQLVEVQVPLRLCVAWVPLRYPDLTQVGVAMNGVLFVHEHPEDPAQICTDSVYRSMSIQHEAIPGCPRHRFFQGPGGVWAPLSSLCDVLIESTLWWTNIAIENGHL